MKNDWLRGVRSGSIALLAIVALAGCGGDGGGGGTVTYSISGRVTLTGTQSARIVACPPTGTTDVTIQDFSYTPTGVTIGVNGIVKWTNNGPSVHTVTSGTSLSPDGLFNSGDLGTGATVCVQFPTPGTYPYFCIPHPFMVGTVTVPSGLSGVTVTLSGATSATTTTDAGGNYTFTGLANGSYTVTPARTGFAFSPASSPQTVSGANIAAVDFTATSVITRFASLDNTQETTGSDSAGKGGGFLTVDTATGKISGFLVHNVADATRAHIHVGPRGTAGGIRVNLTPIDLPSATMYAVPDNTFFLDPVADVASFLAGNLYFNVHNPAFPGGVIRGQIDMTPTSIRFASLDNTQETTGSDSAGKGGGIFAVDEATGRIAGFLVHNVADATRAHIHVGPRGTAGGIRVNLAPIELPSATMYAVPDNTFFLAPAADLASYFAGNLYFNVHNPAFPGGVIRGQIDMTPTSIRFASLDNTQEATGSDSAGKGGGIFAVDEATGRIAGFLVHNVADATRAHIHVGPRGTAGGIRVNLAPIESPSATMYAVPDNTFFLAPAADLASYFAGNLYFNVHNPAFPAGVIRGQIDFP